MRVTGGLLKGRIIECPKGEIRPAMDKMRKSVFAILGDLNEKSWLDLFSGAGTIAIEAVSYGAKKVVLCEKDRLKIKTILKNVAIAEKNANIKIQCHFLAAELFVKRCKECFDYIFLDPPFSYNFHAQLAQECCERGLLQKNGILMIHRPAEKKMSEVIGTLILKDRRFYGRSVVDFYCNF